VGSRVFRVFLGFRVLGEPATNALRENAMLVSLEAEFNEGSLSNEFLLLTFGCQIVLKEGGSVSIVLAHS